MTGDDTEEGRTREPSAPGDGTDDVVQLEIEDSIDLHGFRPRDVPDVVDDYLHEAQKKGYGEVRLIHGRGIGVQRARVQALLARHPLVRSYADAPHYRGGWGATIVQLLPATPQPDDE